ncbi:hypothetical protein HPB50_004842 [Hyalomma asiaticum]|uniref:Uncharacterized protein n=1 Tax=Hyalomma asiaticum TaxID=266040 RepID=A0ACB7SI22_HYAAI|nr:hypothetical protein HPB50_004842 [Hyalomma asiaticum]
MDVCLDYFDVHMCLTSGGERNSVMFDHRSRGRSWLRRAFLFAALLRETGAATLSLGLTMIVVRARAFFFDETSGATLRTRTQPPQDTAHVSINDEDDLRNHNSLSSLFAWHVKMLKCVSVILSVFLLYVLVCLFLIRALGTRGAPINPLTLLTVMVVAAFVILFVVCGVLCCSSRGKEHPV